MKFLFFIAFALIASIGCNPTIPSEDKSQLEKDAKETLNNAHEAAKEIFNPKVYETKEFSCSHNDECGKGLCAENICVCNEGYTSFGEKACSYEQNTKMSTFLLSFFLGSFGADWFHQARGNSQYNWTGFFKLLFGLTAALGGCLLCMADCVCAFLKQNKLQMCFRMTMGGILTLASLVTMIWWFVDWIRVLADSFPDGNGVPLKGF